MNTQNTTRVAEIYDVSRRLIRARIGNMDIAAATMAELAATAADFGATVRDIRPAGCGLPLPTK